MCPAACSATLCQIRSKQALAPPLARFKFEPGVPIMSTVDEDALKPEDFFDPEADHEGEEA